MKIADARITGYTSAAAASLRYASVSESIGLTAPELVPLGPAYLLLSTQLLVTQLLSTQLLVTQLSCKLLEVPDLQAVLITAGSWVVSDKSDLSLGRAGVAGNLQGLGYWLNL